MPQQQEQEQHTRSAVATSASPPRSKAAATRPTGSAKPSAGYAAGTRSPR